MAQARPGEGNEAREIWLGGGNFPSARCSFSRARSLWSLPLFFGGAGECSFGMRSLTELFCARAWATGLEPFLLRLRDDLVGGRALESWVAMCLCN